MPSCPGALRRWDCPIAGTAASIEGLTRAQIQRFYRRHYTAANMVVAVAGNVDHATVVRQVRKAFSRADFLADRAATPATPRRSARFRRAVGGEARVTRPFEQANVVLGVNGLDRTDDRRYALGVLNVVVGGGPSSRLFQEIRERRGLAYSVYSYASHYSDAGTFCVGAGCLPGKLDDVLAVVRAELATLAAEGITEDELVRGKGQLRGGLVLGLEDSASRMSRIAKAELLYDELPSIEEIIRRVDAGHPRGRARPGTLVVRPARDPRGRGTRGASGRRVTAYRHPADPAWTVPYAAWPRRAAAAVVDVALLYPFDLAVGALLARTGNTNTGGLIATGIYASALAFAIWNVVFRQGRTGQSVGKRLLGIRRSPRRPPGPSARGCAWCAPPVTCSTCSLPSWATCGRCGTRAGRPSATSSCTAWCCATSSTPPDPRRRRPGLPWRA